MRKNIASAFLLILSFACSLTLFSQAIIDYQNWSGASGCNIFSSLTNVPATIDGTNTTIAHLSVIGQPQYSGSSDKAVLLKCFDVIDNNGNTTAFKGTEYSITFTFKQGYSYLITVNAACIDSSGTGSNASLRLSPNNGGSGASTQCNGPADIDPNTSGNLYRSNSIINGTIWTDYTYSWYAFSSQQSYLNVAAVPPINSGNQTIFIRKITITETGSPDLVLSPTTLTTTCGTTTAQTFTVSNPSNIQNITSYEWDLGLSNNGWLYNGSAAPQNISTTTNSITLTPDCGSSLSNISVTVRVNNRDYKTYSCTVTVPNPTMSINGSSSFCDGTSSSYTVNGLTCNATVSWSATPSGIVTINSPNSTQTTLTKITDGTVSFTATISNVCGQQIITTKPDIIVGAPVVSFSVQPNDLSQQFCTKFIWKHY